MDRLTQQRDQKQANDEVVRMMRFVEVEKQAECDDLHQLSAEVENKLVSN